MYISKYIQQKLSRPTQTHNDDRGRSRLARIGRCVSGHVSRVLSCITLSGRSDLSERFEPSRGRVDGVVSFGVLQSTPRSRAVKSTGYSDILDSPVVVTSISSRCIPTVPPSDSKDTTTEPSEMYLPNPIRMPQGFIKDITITQKNSNTVKELVLKASIPQLQSLGAGELARLAVMINKSHDQQTRRMERILLRQYITIESKLQQAFMRACTSTEVDSGEKIFDRLLVQCHFLPSQCLQLDKINLSDLGRFIVHDNGQSLSQLHRAELTVVRYTLQQCTGATQQDAINLIDRALQSTDDVMQFRNNKPNNRVEKIHGSPIMHKTTLFAHMHKEVKQYLNEMAGEQDWINHLSASIQDVMLESVCNHVQPSQLMNALQYCLTQNNVPSLDIEHLNSVLTDLVNQFQPSIHLGCQLESPLAKRMENKFAAEMIRQPSKAMVMVAQKINTQLKELSPRHYQLLLDNYVKLPCSYAYSIAQKESLSLSDVRSALANGSNLALTIDFHQYCYDQDDAACLALRLDSMTEFQQNEIQHTWHEKSYFQDICQYRGHKLPLPRLMALDEQLRLIGVGNHFNAVYLSDINIGVTRPSRMFTRLGRHAQESVQADAAYACGVSGRANIHLWGQAIMNQRVPESMRLDQREVRTFLLMIAAVLTADGGHTLGETLAAAFIASRNAHAMTLTSKNVVADLFSHVCEITQPMMEIESRFNHYDMIYSAIEDPYILKTLHNIWDQNLSKV